MTTPRRRWFQFKLSTWFVLVAILCWALACWPWVTYREIVVRGQQAATGAIVFGGIVQRHYSLEPAFVWSTLALLAFLTWKTVWLMVERRRARAAA
jgi:hypothetical protein